MLGVWAGIGVSVFYHRHGVEAIDEVFYGLIVSFPVCTFHSIMSCHIIPIDYNPHHDLATLPNTPLSVPILISHNAALIITFPTIMSLYPCQSQNISLPMYL
jgi:hypothetical protein